MKKFASYKNSLQEYCQKIHAPVPAYRTNRGPAGYLATVSFLTLNCVGDVPTANSKNADQRAAFVALKTIGYIPQNNVFGSAIKGKVVILQPILEILIHLTIVKFFLSFLQNL